MHLWPSLRIRDSFKRVRIGKLEVNLHRIKHSKAGSDPLLSGDSTAQPAGFLGFCHDMLFLFTCCWCCFCCGACGDEEGN